MSSYHQAVKKFLTEINKFINITLKNENLSVSAQKEKEKIVELLLRFYVDYDNLSSGDEGSTSSARDTGAHSSGSISSAKDTSANSSGSASSGKDTLANNSFGDDSRNVADTSMTADDDNYDDNIPDTTVRLLPDPVKIGYLDKKQKALLGALFSWQKRYCVLHKNIMYCFKKPDDKKQQCAFYVTGYEFREAPQNQKDAGKKDCSFELVCPGKKSYQFLASSKEDFQSWREAIQTASKQVTEVNDEDDGDIYEETENYPLKAETPAKPSPPEEVYDDAITMPNPALPAPRSIPPVPQIKQEVTKIEDEDDLIYEPIDQHQQASIPPPLPSHHPKAVSPTASGPVPPPLPSRNVPLPPPPVEIQKPKLTPALGKILQRSEDFENLFYGLWQCESSTPQELSFGRGEIIHIISRDLEKQNWWVGELGGKIGLVPVSYLTPAYELVH
ncbi:src kinase-associated phosphoprotein 2-like [Physella acuta]|uniref:src kinase-associated phosphoprotein 2-like n=1 Tax=Physella acuta TaxID=109671 RepID=UPI0027DD794D|nr:src kinase-associated phosphoprotein 2-like [Physella acuta]